MILLVGNWKASPEKPAQAEKLAKETLSIARAVKKDTSVIVCVPTIHLGAITKKFPALVVGGQNVSQYTDIPHTGEVTASMLKATGATYCIVGHSESRKEGETNEIVAEKIFRLLEKNITPILCVGEDIRDEHGWYLSTIKEQLVVVFGSLPVEKAKKIIIAYEPVWAIGAKAKREATPLECHQMVIYIKKIISDMYSTKIGEKVRVLYGGSVNEVNAPFFITEGNADGFLVGRVSLEPKRFAQLAKKYWKL